MSYSDEKKKSYYAETLRDAAELRCLFSYERDACLAGANAIEELSLATAERQCATGAAEVLFRILGWKEGGIESAALEVEKQIERLRASVKAARVVADWTKECDKNRNGDLNSCVELGIALGDLIHNLRHYEGDVEDYRA